MVPFLNSGCNSKCIEESKALLKNPEYDMFEKIEAGVVLHFSSKILMETLFQYVKVDYIKLSLCSMSAYNAGQSTETALLGVTNYTYLEC